MERIRAHLLAERGMSESKATSVAIATAILFCKSGQSPNLPVHVNAASRAEACTSVAELQAMKEAAKRPVPPEPPEPEPEPEEPPKEPVPEEEPVADAVTEKAWDGSASRFTDEQYAHSCVLDRGPEVTSTKERYSLPVREPDGTLNRNGVHSAAAMIHKVKGASPSILKAAAKALLRLYVKLHEAPPEALVKLAGQAAQEARALTGEVEERSAPDVLSIDGRKLRGVVPYEVESRDLGGFKEVMRRGCLRDADLSDLVATVDHAGLPIGRYPGTLTIEDRADGLHWSVELPASRADVREAVERGDLNASSWRMVVARDSWDGNRRTVEEVRALRDVAVVTTSAYPPAAALAELRTAPIETESKEDEVSEVEVERRDGGALTVEDRSAAPDAGGPIEARMIEWLRSVPRGETRSLDSLTISSAGPVEPSELSTFLWDRLRDRAVVLASGVPVITTSRNSIKWPKVVEDTEAAFYDELEEIDETDPGFDEFDVTPKAIKALVRGSSEAFEDSDPDLMQIVQTNLETILGLKLDRELLIGNDAKGFPGMTNATGIQTIDAAGTMANYDLLLKAIGLLGGAHVAGPYVAITHPYVQTYVSLFKTLTTGETLPRPEGAPAFTTTTQVGRDDVAETSAILVYAPGVIRVVRRRDVTIEVDRSQEFTKDAVFVRGKLRATLFLPYPQAVVKITNVPAPDPAE